MKIQADTEGIKAIRELCDILLRALGIQMHAVVGKVLPVLEEIKKPPKDKEPES